MAKLSLRNILRAVRRLRDAVAQRTPSDAGEPRGSRRRILLWTLLIAAICGVLEAGEPLDDVLKAARDWTRARPSSGQIVVVGVDDKTGSRLGGFAFSRRHDAELVETLLRLGAHRVFFDRVYADATGPAGDREFARVLMRHRGRVFLGAISPYGPDRKRTETLPHPRFRHAAPYVSLNGAKTPLQLSANLTFADELGGRLVPSLSSALAGSPLRQTDYYRPDWSIQIDTVPTVSFADVIDGRVPAKRIAGKDVVVGPTSPSLQDIHLILFQGQNPGVYFHVIGAETLRAGTPVNWGWLPAFAVSLLLSILFLTVEVRRTQALIVGAGAALLLLLPIPLSAWLVQLDVVPALLLFGIVTWRGSTLRRVEHSQRTHSTSGLPNLFALIGEADLRAETLIALKLRNHAQILSSFEGETERELFQEIRRRLEIAGIGRVYHREDALFWSTAQPVNEELINHIRGLHKLLQQGVRLADRETDILTSFGIDADLDRPLRSRAASAALCAEEAARSNEVWRVYNAELSHASAWQLSLMSRLEVALQNGEIWVAYQPKVLLGDGRIIGAEALVRWQHPTAGALRPDHFIAAAEAHNRIAEITYFVLDRALADLCLLRAQGFELGVAVNLSAQMLNEDDLVARVLRALRRYDMPAHWLTLEVTETGDLLSTADHVRIMTELAALGVQLSIDDYGTGNATLEYLARLPSQEIKIDRTFITDLDQSEQNLILVRSTLDMAHKLGRKVVAEGVEKNEVMAVLRDLGCDVAQGYLLSKPVPIDDLVRILSQSAPQRRVRVVIS